MLWMTEACGVELCTENSNPGKMVMESAEDGNRFNASGPLNRTSYRRIFVQ
jgi:hypothetical protein